MKPPRKNPNLSQRLGYAFTQPKLLEQALTHRSHGRTNYERLEFLGDAVLNLSISCALLARYPQAKEGDLSRLRAHLVQESTLASLARNFQLGEHLKLGEGELKSGGQERASILADAVEALIGAIFLDSNFDTAQKILLAWYEPLFNTATLNEDKKDPKTVLQEYLQSRKEPLPEYKILEISGQSHVQLFTVMCTVASRALHTEGQANNRRAAEKIAAQKMLTLLLPLGTKPN